MKRTILSILVSLVFFTSFAQRLHFSDLTNVWSIKATRTGGHMSGGTSEYPLSYSGTSIVRGQQYHVLTENYIREDTLTKKVYILLGDSSEPILYDYNLLPGDTLNNSRVTQIDSTQINGQSYKIWYFSANSGIYHYTVIEGIGCINGYDFPVSSYHFNVNYADQLFCFQNSGATYPLSNPLSVTHEFLGDDYIFDNTTSCAQIAAMAVSKLNDEKPTVSVFPNPVNETSRIVFSYNISSGSLQVINGVGQTIINTTFQNKEEVLLGDKINTPGFYFYRVMDNQSGNMFSGKFVY